MSVGSIYPMPAFLPAGKVIKQSQWDDFGEWDDDANMFNPAPEYSEYLEVSTGAYLETQNGLQILL